MNNQKKFLMYNIAIMVCTFLGGAMFISALSNIQGDFYSGQYDWLGNKIVDVNLNDGVTRIMFYETLSDVVQGIFFLFVASIFYTDSKWLMK